MKVWREESKKRNAMIKLQSPMLFQRILKSRKILGWFYRGREILSLDRKDSD